MPASKVPEVAHLIAHLLRVPFDDSPVVTPLLESPQRLEARLFMALKRFIQAEAERHPVFVVIENLEMCGQDTINFVHYLAAGLRDARVVLIGTATNALYERHPSFGDGEVAPTRIDLGALSPSEAEDSVPRAVPPAARSATERWSLTSAASAARRARSTSSCACCSRTTASCARA